MIPYIIQKFRGGISDESTVGIPGAFKYAYGMDIHKRRDSLSCNYKMFGIGASTAINDLIKYTIQARDGSTYAFGSAGSVYAISGKVDDPVVTYVYTDYNGEIKGAAEWKHSDGNNYLYWATNTSIARFALNGSPDMPLAGGGVVTADYKTTLDSADYHPMKNTAGLLTIGNGNFLATIDYQGNFNPAATNLRPGNIVKCLDEKDDYAVVGSERVDESEEGHIWTWLPDITKNWIQKKKIPVKGVNALITAERPLLQGGISGEIFEADFVNSEPIISIPGGGQANPHGVGIYNDLALFGFYNAGDQSGIYSYGRRAKNRPQVLNHEFRLAETVTGNTLKEIGSVWVSSSAVFASYKVEGSATYYGVDMVSTSTRASARYEGLEFNGGSPHLKKHYESQKVVMEPLPSGTTVSVIYKQDRANTSESESGSQGSGWRYAKVGGGTTTAFAITDATEAEFIIDANSRVYEIGLELEPSGTSTPEVTALVGYLEGAEEH